MFQRFCFSFFSIIIGSYCMKSFTRREHLINHTRQHTGGILFHDTIIRSSWCNSIRINQLTFICIRFRRDSIQMWILPKSICTKRFEFFEFTCGFFEMIFRWQFDILIAIDFLQIIWTTIETRYVFLSYRNATTATTKELAKWLFIEIFFIVIFANSSVERYNNIKILFWINSPFLCNFCSFLRPNYVDTAHR